MEELKQRYQSLTPLQLFEKIINDEIYEHIVKESVRYAVCVKNCQEFTLTADDVRVFVGFLLYTGYHKLPSERNYWSEEEDLGEDFVKKSMSRNKYQKIKSMLHFQDNDLASEKKCDRGFKVRPLMDLVNSSFQQFGIFEQCVSIDEMIVKYYGHHSLKQFIRGKPIRFGYKVWALCGASGYCFYFCFYCGKDSTISERDDLLLGSKVVLNMLDCIEEPKSHCVFFDNFFTNRDLLIYLRKLGYRACGTVRDNRIGDCPLKSTKEMKKDKRGAMDFQFDCNGEVLFVRWNDNKCVTIGTNFETINPLSSVARWNRRLKQMTNVPQPKALKSYNKHMGGVDHHDWLVSKYCINIRGKKWYWPLFIRMVDMALVNAWLIYRHIHGTSAVDLLNFRRAVAVPYLKLDSNRNKAGRPFTSPSSHVRVISDVKFDGVGHIIARRKEQRRCAFIDCKAKPRSYCTKCNATLCIQCFAPYHKK